MSDCRREVPFGIRFMTIVSLGKSSSTSLKNGVCMIGSATGHTTLDGSARKPWHSHFDATGAYISDWR